MLGYLQAQEGDTSALAVALGPGPGVLGLASPGEALLHSWTRSRAFGGDQHIVFMDLMQG